MNVILRKDKTGQYLAKYFHAACFSPTSRTLINAIKRNHFVSWTGLTSDLIRKYLPLSIQTRNIYLNQEKQGLRSTKALIDPQHDNTSDDLYAPTPTPNYRTHEEVYSVISVNEKVYIYIKVRFLYC